jgi:unsaturated rhamnogalacturonyl hydrolase
MTRQDSHNRTKKKKPIKFHIFFLTIIVISCFAIGCTSESSQIEIQNKPWSVRMTESVMKRNPESWMIDFREKPKWEYTQGLVLKAILEVWHEQQDERYLKYVLEYYNQFIKEDGNIWLYKLEDYNIDRINPGKPLFTLYKITGNEKFKKAIYRLRKQMKTHPRTNEGGFWHKKKYPYQMWLDGLYMASPFLAEFAVTFNEPELMEDIADQFVWMENHARDEKTGLLYHGWDESRQQQWSDPETGLSQNFWGRAMGWYMMALVDVLDFYPEDHQRRPDIIAILKRLSTALSKFQDKKTGVWYQVIDQKERAGNYPESSASCMYVYSIIKAVKHNYIDSKFMKVAQKGYDGILKQFIKIDQKGFVNILNACSVAGLGGDPYRDGSYEYYISEPIRNNDPKAVGPFILASLEIESLN